MTSRTRTCDQHENRQRRSSSHVDGCSAFAHDDTGVVADAHDTARRKDTDMIRDGPYQWLRGIPLNVPENCRQSESFGRQYARMNAHTVDGRHAIDGTVGKCCFLHGFETGVRDIQDEVPHNDARPDLTSDIKKTVEGIRAGSPKNLFRRVEDSWKRE